jgi:hypothetical protein
MAAILPSEEDLMVVAGSFGNIFSPTASMMLSRASRYQDWCSSFGKPYLQSARPPTIARQGCGGGEGSDKESEIEVCLGHQEESC